MVSPAWIFASSSGDEFRLGGGVEQRALARAAAHRGEHARRAAVDRGVARPADGQRQEIAADRPACPLTSATTASEAVAGVLERDGRRQLAREQARCALSANQRRSRQEVRQHVVLEACARVQLDSGVFQPSARAPAW